ncbi:MAG: ABC transporter permease [Clostridiales bacterium]|nr:ABC transporter permease [Clostridiales bacterium]
MAIPTFLGITLLTYLILSLAGSPLDAFLADPRISPAELERKRVSLGLDQPIFVQYFVWLKNFLSGDLGYSIASRKEVMALIMDRIGITALLAASSILLSLLVSIPLGIFSAAKPNSLQDHLASGISFFLVAMPNFFLGMLMIYIFAVRLKWLPTGGLYDSVGEKTPLMLLRHMILPCLILSFQNIGSWMRYMRGSMLEVLQNDYILTARAKGLNKAQVYRRHALKNSLIPIITVVGMSIPSLVGGAVITEQVFSWPGIGSLMVSSIQAKDYPVIMGITVMIAVAVLLSNLLTDLAYGLIDPRISYDK